MVLRDLIEADKKGFDIKFDMHHHPRIQNRVSVNGTCWSGISHSTHEAFKKYKAFKK